MKYLYRALCWVIAVGTVHLVLLSQDGGSPLFTIIRSLLLLGMYTWISVQPRIRKVPTYDPRLLASASPPAPPAEPRRLATLINGYELLLAAGVSLLAALAWWIWLGVAGLQLDGAPSLVVYIVDIIVGVVMILGLALNGFVRLIIASKQLPLLHKVAIALMWWLPPVTVAFVGRAVRTAMLEVGTATAQHARDQARLPAQVCRTRHPLLLVHGVFFRDDWSLRNLAPDALVDGLARLGHEGPAFNYWGRIPDALIANGATISYGDQDGSRPVADCGAQLVAAIEAAAAATGKVNIIAHSKGGLDARWAISRLGMAAKVASLTTVNTPHRGCNFARQLLEIIPKQVQQVIAQGSDTIFAKLGDPNPDFLAAVADLTDTECARLNELMPDAPGVVYLSVGSRMASAAAAPFPLNVGYTLISPTGGPNDGLVAVSSMPWGEYLGTVEPTGDRGLSHADMIDLMRRDVDGFDVREHYVGLVSGLRERGL